MAQGKAGGSRKAPEKLRVSETASFLSLFYGRCVMEEKTVMIEGMTEEAARKYVKMREKLDRKLVQIGNLGKVIDYSSSSGATDIELPTLGDVGDVIYEMAGDLLGEMDEYLSYSTVYLEIGKIDKQKEVDKTG